MDILTNTGKRKDTTNGVLNRQSLIIELEVKDLIWNLSLCLVLREKTQWDSERRIH
jgi:hypothetical protein